MIQLSGDALSHPQLADIISYIITLQGNHILL